MKINVGGNAKNWLIKGVFDKGFIWKPSNCECERDNSCDIDEYLDYENCKWRKKLLDKLVEECTENIEETRLVEKTSTKNKNKHKFSSCTLYIMLFLIIFTINVGIGTHFVYSRWYLKNWWYSCYAWYPYWNNISLNL